MNFDALSAAGLLGNTFRSFKDWAALEASGYRGWLTVRSRTASDKALFIPEVHYSGIPLGTLRSSAVYFQEVQPPGTYRVANLEAGYMGGVSRPGLHLRYTTGDARNLRHSLDERGKDVHGAQAARVLRELAGSDADTLHELWDRYPDAVIEASVFGCSVGHLRKPLIIWEVRDY